MNNELDKQLCRHYPELYRYRQDIGRTLMYRGFECGDGWFVLIDVISELLTKRNTAVFAVNVREKMGTLRFVHKIADLYTTGIVSAAEKMTKWICEHCGAPAILNQDHDWWSTRCIEHISKHLISYNPEIDISSVINLRLGKAWSRLVVILQEAADCHANRNGMAKVKFTVNKINGKLLITFHGSDEMIAGMVDVITHYANRINEHTGLVATV